MPIAICGSAAKFPTRQRGITTFTSIERPDPCFYGNSEQRDVLSSQRGKVESISFLNLAGEFGNKADGTLQLMCPITHGISYTTVGGGGALGTGTAHAPPYVCVPLRFSLLSLLQPKDLVRALTAEWGVCWLSWPLLLLPPLR